MCYLYVYICLWMYWITQHCDYDVHVVNYALSNKWFDLIWFDLIMLLAVLSYLCNYYIIPGLVTVLTASAPFIELEMYDTADTATFRGVRAWRHMSPLFGQKNNTNLAWKLKMFSRKRYKGVFWKKLLLVSFESFPLSGSFSKLGPPPHFPILS